MGIRPEFRWWILALVVIGLLLGISALALDRPDVAWTGEQPACPHCRSEVPAYGTRCPHCAQLFDWVPAPEEESPRCRTCLSAPEATWAWERINALGPEAARQRIAQALEVSAGGADLYVSRLGRGRCGWCGGSGLDPATVPESRARCPACLGREQCPGCGGNRAVRVGDAGAARALRVYERDLLDVSPLLPEALQVEERRRLAAAFLERHAGTIEAARVQFWPLPPHSVTEACRHRLEGALRALAAE
jgi:hypothetical protein